MPFVFVHAAAASFDLGAVRRHRAVSAGSAIILMIRAFQLGQAAVLAPLGYVELVGTATLGYLIFGNFPDLPTWIGAGIIIASGLYIALRERRLRLAGEPTTGTGLV